MGVTSGPPRKPDGARKGHRKYSSTAIVPLKSAPRVPELPDSKKFLAATRQAWERYWSSPIQQVLVPDSDMPALVRLFQLADEFERCRREFARKRLVEGSQGQPVINPLGPFMLALAKEVRALDDRFGGSVISRLRMSIDLGEAAKSLDAMNQRLAAAEESDADQVEDPRVAKLAIGGASSEGLARGVVREVVSPVRRPRRG
jgi:hypothetical protein